MISNCFYYGVYSPKGFYSLASKPTFSAQRNYAVKGFSDFAKQRLFDSIKNELDKRGCSYIDFCADDRSMGVYSQDAGFRIIDTTYETIPFEAETFLLDGTINNQHEKWLSLRREAVLRTQRFLTACRCINNDMSRLESTDMDIAKVNRYSTRLWNSTGGVLKGNVGTEHKRFVTCFTSEGVELNMDAFDIYCDNITLLCDKTGTCARRIVDRVRRYALSAGYDVISCLCPLNIENGAEHLIIPELKYGIFVCKHFHKGDFRNCKKSYSARFLVPENTETKKRMDFSFKAYKRLMQEVFSSLKTVKKCDDELNMLLSENTTAAKERKIIEILFSY